MADSPQSTRKGKSSSFPKKASKSPFPKAKWSHDRRGFLKAAGIAVAAAMLPRRLAADTAWMDSAWSGGNLSSSSYGSGCANYLSYYYMGSVLGSPPSWDELVGELDSGCAVGVRIEWYGSGSDYVLLTGYNTCDNSSMMEVSDDYFGGSLQDFSTFPSDYMGGGDWGDTYYVD